MSAARASRRARTRPSASIAAMNCVPLTSDSPSFAASRTGSRPARASASAPASRSPLDPRLALADERQREMRERREVAGGADRAAARHDRQHAAVEQREQQLDGLDPRARVALRERVRAQEHRRADDLVGVRLADAARVRAEQPQLQLGGLLLRDRDRDEAAEAGVDAVGVLAACRARRARRARGRRSSSPAPVGELGARPFDRDRPDVVDRQVVAREADRRPLRHDASLGRSPRRPSPYVPPGGFATPCRHRTGRRCHASVAALARLARRAAGVMPRRRAGAAAPARATGRGRHAEEGAGRSDRRARREQARRAPSRRPRSPLAVASRCTAATTSCSGDARQSSMLRLTWTCPACGRRSPSARTPGKPPSRSRTARATSRAASRSSPSRSTLKAISGARAPTSTPPARSSSRAGPKSGASSPASRRRCSSAGPPRRKKAGPRPGARSA